MQKFRPKISQVWIDLYSCDLLNYCDYVDDRVNLFLYYNDKLHQLWSYIYSYCGHLVISALDFIAKWWTLRWPVTSNFTQLFSEKIVRTGKRQELCYSNSGPIVNAFYLYRLIVQALPAPFTVRMHDNKRDVFMVGNYSYPAKCSKATCHQFTNVETQQNSKHLWTFFIKIQRNKNVWLKMQFRNLIKVTTK